MTIMAGITLEEIEDTLKDSSALPWKEALGDVGKYDDLIVSIENAYGPILEPEYGLNFGITKDNEAEIRAKSKLILLSKLWITILLKALLFACDQKRLEAGYFLAHAEKEVLESLGILKKKKVLTSFINGIEKKN